MLKFPTQLSPTNRQLLTQLITSHANFHYQMGPKFAFCPPRTIIFGPYEPHYLLLCCHELGHALSGHTHFQTDLERLKLERSAWEVARHLCHQYHIPFDPDFVEDQLDSYRDWLHHQSRCPRCGLSRYQTKNGQYHCPNCELTI